MTPFLVLWFQEPWTRWTSRRWAEAALLILALVVVGEIVFGGLLPIAGKKYPIPFLMVPLLVWAALRFGPRETATVMLLTSAIAIWGTLRGYGPFARDPHNEALLMLQVFTGVVAVMALTLATAVASHRRITEALREVQADLEHRVQLRTAELAKSNAALRQQVLERQAAEEQLRHHEEQLLETQGLAQLGGWSWDVLSNAVTWSPQLYRVYGLTPETFEGTYKAFLERVHPDDRAMVEGIVSTAFDNHQPFSFYHRIVRPDGTERILHGRGQVVVDGHGRVLKMFGTGQDVTDLKRAEQALRRAHDEMEKRVQERTLELARANAALQEKIADLEQFEEAVVGRELKMIELEKEMERLQQSIQGGERPT
jgi:PAS domain S-box-containing protein